MMEMMDDQDCRDFFFFFWFLAYLLLRTCPSFWLDRERNSSARGAQPAVSAISALQP